MYFTYSVKLDKTGSGKRVKLGSKSRQGSHGDRGMRLSQTQHGPQRGKKKKADCEFWGLESNSRSKSHDSAQITAEKNGHWQRLIAEVVVLILAQKDPSNFQQRRVVRTAEPSINCGGGQRTGKKNSCFNRTEERART